MPNANALERQRQEEQNPAPDDVFVLDSLQARARRLGYTSVTAALDALEEGTNDAPVR